jgi:hypothetical protein
MKINFLTFALLLFVITLKAQTKDTWSNVPEASDDRYTNPKKPLYAGPNGWWSSGEIRVKDNVAYSFKGGLNEISVGYALTNAAKLLTLFLSFEEETPVTGKYEVAEKGNVAAKKIHVSFSDVSNKQIKDWRAVSGTVEVTKLDGFIYFKARNIGLEPPKSPMNKADKPIALGFEGAVKIYD